MVLGSRLLLGDCGSVCWGKTFGLWLSVVEQIFVGWLWLGVGGQTLLSDFGSVLQEGPT